MKNTFTTTYPQAGDPAATDPMATGDDAAPEAERQLGESLERAGWTAVVETLKRRWSAHTFRTYVAPAVVVDVRPGALRLGYGSDFMVDQVRDYYRGHFEGELLRVCNRRVTVELTVVKTEAAPEPPGPPPPPSLELVSADEPPGRRPSPKDRGQLRVDPVAPGEPPVGRRGPSGLESRYTLDNFVVGTSNEFAHAACKAVAGNPGRTYNPLFLYGGVGLGKTHLMQAVGNKVLADRPNAVVLYTSCEQFTNDMVASLQSNRMLEFRRRYRECDLLLIDDVQFLAKKVATQEEFFHTFNVLHAKGSQIIVSSDTVPNELNGMEERLRSRFQWGLIADVQPPEMETRLAILRSKAEAMRLSLADDVAQFLAVHIRQNVRELEGSLVRIAAFSSLMKGPITLEVCREVLRSVLVNRGEKVDGEQIIKVCAERFGVTAAEIKGRVRTKHLARARQAAMYLTRIVTKASFPEIGRKFGGKDHSTVINACDRVRELMAADPDFRKAVEALEADFRGL